MSKKHNQRTRAEILAKRERAIPTERQNCDRFGIPVSTPHTDVRRASRSKYTPHFGKKQQAKLARDALNLAA